MHVTNSALLLLVLASAVLAAVPDDYPSDDSSRFPHELTPVASRIYKAAVTTALDTPTTPPPPPTLLGAPGRLISPLVDLGAPREFARRVIAPTILQAEEEILMTTFIYNKESPTAQGIREALMQLDKRQ